MFASSFLRINPSIFLTHDKIKRCRRFGLYPSEVGGREGCLPAGHSDHAFYS